MKTILFYSSVADISLFSTQKFYVNTIEILKEIGFDVIVSNNIQDSWKCDYDAIFSFFYRKSLFPSFVAKLRGKKVFFTGGIDSMEKRITPVTSYVVQVFFFKICRWIADWCLVESMSDMRNINKVCLIKNHKNLYYSPQAMDLSLYHSFESERENSFVTIGWMGAEANVKRKGMDQSLFYFKFLKSFEGFKESTLYIMGREGFGTEYLKTLVEALGLHNDVCFLGEVTDEEKIAYLKRCKYYFQLSKYEGFGLAALEALASGCIVVHSGRGGIADSIGDDGVFVDISKFSNSLESIDQTVYDKIVSISNYDYAKVLTRLNHTFDKRVRVENFKKTIGKSMGL